MNFISTLNGLSDEYKDAIRARIIRFTEAGPGGCLIWMRSKNESGYGTIAIKGKSQLVHRIAYLLRHTEIANGLPLDHLCRNRPCCNPDHLEPVTALENTRRGNKCGSVCAKGHDMADAYVFSGRRACKVCVKQSRKRRLGKRRIASRLAYSKMTPDQKLARSQYQKAWRNKKGKTNE